MICSGTFPPEPDSVRAVREFVRRYLREHGRSSSDAVLVADELSSNAVRHAGTRYMVTLDLDRRGYLDVEVTDGSPELTVELVPEMVGGYGLLVVERLSTAWGVARVGGCKTVWARVPVSCSQDGAAPGEILSVREVSAHGEADRAGSLPAVSIDLAAPSKPGFVSSPSSS